MYSGAFNQDQQFEELTGQLAAKKVSFMSEQGSRVELYLMRLSNDPTREI